MALRPATPLVLLLAAPLVPAPTREPPQPAPVKLDMVQGWHRRDWQKCQDPTEVTFADGLIAFDSRRASALVWQVPTLTGPAEIDASLRWIRDCDRAPASFIRGILERSDESRLISLADHPLLSWRWKVDRLVDDSATVGRGGRVRREGNDFAAKLGVLIAEDDGKAAHEIAYVWTRSLPLGTVLYQEATVVPLLRKVRGYRIVVETGDEHLGQWVGELRDVGADFERIFPGRRAGRVLRVDLMTDSDNTAGSAAASYADILLLPRRP